MTPKALPSGLVQENPGLAAPEFHVASAALVQMFRW
jgi:hypothetical protein